MFPDTVWAKILALLCAEQIAPPPDGITPYPPPNLRVGSGIVWPVAYLVWRADWEHNWVAFGRARRQDLDILNYVAQGVRVRAIIHRAFEEGPGAGSQAWPRKHNTVGRYCHACDARMGPYLLDDSFDECPRCARYMCKHCLWEQHNCIGAQQNLRADLPFLHLSGKARQPRQPTARWLDRWTRDVAAADLATSSSGRLTTLWTT